ncbi:MAG: thiamine-phosphate kinase [Candidatus Acidiferrum sp.]
MTRVTQNENSLIRRIERSASRYASSKLSLGIGDDAALFSPRAGYKMVLTCDWFLEGTHFMRQKHPPDSIGWKCLARAVSDIAAMGGVPKCFLLSLAVPNSHTQNWLDEFLRGLGHAARQLQCPLAGGDTTERNELLINVTVVGEVKTGHAVLRCGARPGDIIYVSGTLGEAEMGLQLLRKAKRIPTKKSPLLRKHLYPRPRLKLGRWLAEKRVVTAMMDVSDGLSSDLPRLCEASGIGARVEATKLPKLPQPLMADTDRGAAQQLALHGGDDYELLFTVPRGKVREIPPSLDGLSLTAIGETTKGRRILLINKQGGAQPLAAQGWDPFR